MTVTATQGTGASTGTPVTTVGTQFATDLNMFLKLLTTQMQNQDPLNPMDTAQYTQQLVQYSQVEQSIQQNGTLKDILSRLSSQNLTQSSGLIGQEVRFASDVAGLSDQPARWNWTTDRSLGSLEATVKDASGRVVATQSVDPAKAGTFSWDGTKSDGTKASAGSYTMSLEGTDLAGAAVTITPQALATVSGVSLVNGTITLNAGGANYPDSAVVGVGIK